MERTRKPSGMMTKWSEGVNEPPETEVVYIIIEAKNKM